MWFFHWNTPHPDDSEPLIENFEDISDNAQRKKWEIVERKAQEAADAHDAELIARLSWLWEQVRHDTDAIVSSENDNWTLESTREGPYIDDDTLLIIPRNLVRQYPFFALAQWKNTLKLSELAGLSLRDKQSAIRMLGSEIEIQNWEAVEKILLNQIISIWKWRGSLNDYLRHPHQIWFTELR